MGERVEVFVQVWHESEKGMGRRPAGISLHCSRKDLDQFVSAHWSALPDDVVPDLYALPVGDAWALFVAPELAERVQGLGLRVRDNARARQLLTEWGPDE